MDLRNEIVAFIHGEACALEDSSYFRQPLVRFAATSDPYFAALKDIVGPHHLLPGDILPQARTAVSFFLPFSAAVVASNRGNNEVSREWAAAYIKANKAINTISTRLVEMLTAKEIPAATVAATHTYDAETLTASWSHRSVAFITGQGRFGLNRMLITPVGCAGRYGSVLLSAEIDADQRPEDEPCLYLKNGSCRFCITNCPTQALSEKSIDRHLCNNHLLEVSKNFTDLGLCDVCGKCAVGPCAYIS